jgi:hypothetical protein
LLGGRAHFLQLILHRGDLFAHHISLFLGVVCADDDCDDANGSRDPNSNSLSSSTQNLFPSKRKVSFSTWR